MSGKETKPNTAKLLRDFERCKAAKERADIAHRKASDALAMAENKLRNATGLGVQGAYMGSVTFTTTPVVRIS